MLGLANVLSAGVAPSSEWQPTDLDNLALWLKNDTGVAVEQWDDSSGNNNHATQGTSGNQAAVSGGGLDFENGESDHYDLTSKIVISENQNLLMSFVVTLESISAARCILSDATSEFIDFQTNKKIRINCSGTTTSLSMASSTFGTASKFIITISRNDGETGTFVIYKDGTELSGTFGNETNPANIEFHVLGGRAGSDRFFDGIIHEVIVYDLGTSAHAADDITNLNNYLTTKFGL